MGLVTVCAGALAVRFDSMLVAVLGIIGGYGTPVMLATGEANFVGLYSYMLILGCGIFGISLRKNWHLLNYLGSCAPTACSSRSMQEYHQDEFWQRMPFLVGVLRALLDDAVPVQRGPPDEEHAAGTARPDAQRRDLLRRELPAGERIYGHRAVAVGHAGPHGLLRGARRTTS